MWALGSEVLADGKCAPLSEEAARGSGHTGLFMLQGPDLKILDGTVCHI